MSFLRLQTMIKVKILHREVVNKRKVYKALFVFRLL
jgi:hypothetical protein